MQIGTKVRKVVPDIDGTVTAARWDEKEAALHVCVACDLDGMPHQRWFAASELEVIAAPGESK